MITPKLYAWKGTKWIRKIEFLAGNQKGFWEVRGYSDTAEPWFDDRYSWTRSRFAIAFRQAQCSRKPASDAGDAARHTAAARRSGARLRAQVRRHPRHRRGDTGDAASAGADLVAARQREDGAVSGAHRRGRARGDAISKAPSFSTAKWWRSTKGRPAGFQRLQHRIHVSVPGYRSRKPILPPDEQPAALHRLRSAARRRRRTCAASRWASVAARSRRSSRSIPPPRACCGMSEQSRGDGRALMARARSGGLGRPARQARDIAVSRRPAQPGVAQAQDGRCRTSSWSAAGPTPKGAARIFRVADARVQLGTKLAKLVKSARRRSASHAGDVGTGFSGAELDRVLKMLEPLETPTSPFDPPPKIASAGRTGCGRSWSRRCDTRKSPTMGDCDIRPIWA